MKSTSIQLKLYFCRFSSYCLSAILIIFSYFQLKEEHSVQGSDEEVDEPPEVDSDEDLSDDNRKQIHEEVRKGCSRLVFFVQ